MTNSQFPTGDIYRLGLASGDPGAYQNLNQDQSRLFGLALQDLLKSYQKVNQTPFMQQGYNAQQEQINRTIGTDPNLIGAAPSVQSAARNASVNAVEPTVKGAEQAGQTFQGQLNSFSDIIGKGMDLLKNYTDEQDKQRTDARNIINQALNQFGSRAFDILDPKYWKIAGYDDKAKMQAQQTIKEQEMEQKLNKQTNSDSQRGAVSDMAKVLDSYAGADGHVSPSDYLKMRMEWVRRTGYTAEDFDKAFIDYVDPTHAQDYRVTTKSNQSTPLF